MRIKSICFYDSYSWEQRKLGDVVGVYDGTHQTPNYQDHGVMFVSVEDIQTLTSEKYISEEDYEKNYSVVPEQGDILMTRIGDIGTANIVKSAEPLAYYVSLALLKNKGVNSEFLKANISAPAFQNELWLRTLHTAYPKKINKDEIGKCMISIAPSIEEQEAIGRYFESFDNLITLHQYKYFPKLIAYWSLHTLIIPFVWEQRKLLDCIQKITDFRGRTPKKLGMDWSEEGYLALSALNVKDGYIDFNQDVHYGNQELYDKWMTGNELHKGQVLFTTEAPMGNVAQVPDNRRYILSQRTIAFDVKDNLITENFLATVLRTPTVFADLTALSSGGTAKGVSQKSLSSVEIRLPKDLREQEIIADTFLNIDNLITLHQREQFTGNKVILSLNSK